MSADEANIVEINRNFVFAVITEDQTLIFLTF